MNTFRKGIGQVSVATGNDRPCIGNTFDLSSSMTGSLPVELVAGSRLVKTVWQARERVYRFSPVPYATTLKVDSISGNNSFFCTDGPPVDLDVYRYLPPVSIKFGAP